MKHLATAMWGDAGIARHFLNFYATYGGQLIGPPATFLPGKRPLVPIGQEADPVRLATAYKRKISTPVRN
jgi:hypothetical protein